MNEKLISALNAAIAQFNANKTAENWNILQTVCAKITAIAKLDAGRRKAPSPLPVTAFAVINTEPGFGASVQPARKCQLDEGGVVVYDGEILLVECNDPNKQALGTVAVKVWAPSAALNGACIVQEGIYLDGGKPDMFRLALAGTNVGTTVEISRL